jgi:hypothetical protein
MRDDCFSPVDEDRPALADEDIAVVRLHVRDRERNRPSQALRGSTHNVEPIAAQGGVALREQLWPVVGRTERERAVDDAHEVDLHLGIQRDDFLPGRPGLACIESVAKTWADVARQHPTAFPCDHVRQPILSPA